MDEVIEVLRREFEAEEGSFLLRLRGDLEWDRTAFSRLERAMRTVCERSQGSEKLDRWLAEGFYEIATCVPIWTSLPNSAVPSRNSFAPRSAVALTAVTSAPVDAAGSVT
ncbi:hypothetical protein [Streptomyces sp. NBC_01361]|uniref:hypothetical protein n=1 Tax=Streptomyces sp. NBC_01361 TaxID=2903838 RepID=UPI002E35DD21|nr:hypothetical protein [Streptomyces sp. NBC_01361]